MEEVGLTDEVSRMKGHIHLDNREFLHGGGAVNPTLWIGDMGDISMHWEDAGDISPTGDKLTDRSAAKTPGGWELGITSIVNDYGRGGLGGSGAVYDPPT